MFSYISFQEREDIFCKTTHTTSDCDLFIYLLGYHTVYHCWRLLFFISLQFYLFPFLTPLTLNPSHQSLTGRPLKTHSGLPSLLLSGHPLLKSRYPLFHVSESPHYTNHSSPYRSLGQVYGISFVLPLTVLLSLITTSSQSNTFLNVWYLPWI